MLVSEQARVFQVRGLRCSKEPTVLGLSPVRLGNRTYRAWRTTKLTPMMRFVTAPTGPGENWNYRFKYLNFIKPHLPGLIADNYLTDSIPLNGIHIKTDTQSGCV